MSENPQMQDRIDAEQQLQAGQASVNSAMDAASRRTQKRLENPEFFQQLRDPDIDSDEFDWLENELGPIFSGAHIIGQRDSSYERQAKWLNEARGQRIIAEGDPGRLCKGPLLAISQRVHNRGDKRVTERYTQDEKRAIRDAMSASTNLKSLAIGAKGLDSVTTATAVSKVEKSESEEQSMRERAGSLLR